MLHWCLFSLLVLHLSGAASLTVHGQKDGSVSLPSNKSIGENLTLRLTCRSKVAYGGQQNEQFKGRVNKSDLCGHYCGLKDVKTTDTGKYTLSIYGNGDPIYTSFDIHVIVNLTVRKGEELVFDDRPLEAETVERCKGTVCTEIWRRERGVLNERLNDSNGRLVIREFNSSDAGIYRVLNSTGGELVTVNVTESGTESEGNDLNSTDDHRTDDTEQHSARVWIVAPLALMALII
ncbi:hypothetical protein PO909_003898 [Leuciscus waleckii]